ncbi:MAG TPA: ABC transporter permease [Thermoplasmata archaeon]|nr:ABC transporter permease [Thermoplasmata archaeon]
MGPAAQGSGAPPSSPKARSAPPSLLRAELRSAFRIFRSNPLSFAGFVIVVIICLTALLVAVAPGLVLPYPPLQPGPTAFSNPSWQHPLGTDELGEDMLSRVLAALPLDLGLGLGIAGISLVLGGALGLIAGYWDRPRTLGGVASAIILRLADIFLAFPTLVLALAIFGALGGGLNAAVVALLVTWWPYYTRVTRGEVLSIKERPYVVAARAAGVSELRILTRHVLRNLLEPLAVYYTLDVGTVIVTFSTIAYAGGSGGIGFPLRDLEWGNMVQYYASNFLPAHPWPVFAPGLMIFITVLGFSLLGDGLRDVLDPRSRRVLGSVGEEAAPVRETAPATPGGA